MGLEQKAVAIIESETDNFVVLCDLAGLDRKHDFRHANLSGVDFNNCDLRGFDFTGADLRGSHGVNVTVDATTIFIDADLRDSIFEAKE